MNLEASLVEMFEQRHRGARNAHRVMILEDETTITSKVVSRCDYCDRQGEHGTECEGCGASSRTERIEGKVTMQVKIPKPTQGEPEAS